MDLPPILALWEAVATPGTGRAARLLAAAGETDPGALSLGTAAVRLLGLRRALLGDTLEGVADCPACGTRHDVRLDAATLALPTAPAKPEPILVEHAGWRAVLRVPSLDDCAAAGRCADAATGAELLRDAAILALDGPGDPPDGLLPAIEAALDAAEPLADARLPLACTGCGSSWDVAFDPADFLAAELAGLAKQQMAEVATLARAYGWSEAAILAMPPARRRVYRELAG